MAAGLARKGQRTLLVDINSQANSSKVLLPDYLRIPKEQTIYATIRQRKALPVHPTAIDHREEQLKRQLAPLAPTTTTWSSTVRRRCPG